MSPKALTNSRSAHTASIGVWLALWVAAAAILSFFGEPPSGPAVFPDELCNLSWARFISGVGSHYAMDMAGYCHPAYPLILSPLFWLTSDSESFYHGVYYLNTAMVALMLPLSIHIARRHFGLNYIYAVAIGLIVFTYPGALLMRHHAWPESALFTGTLIIFLAYCRWIDNQSWRNFFFLVTSALALYAIHPKTIIFSWLLLTGLLLGYFFLKDAPSRLRITTSAFGILLLLFLFSVIKEYATATVWRSGSVDVIGQVVASGSFDNISTLIAKATGVMFYAGIMTGGLVFILLAAGLRALAWSWKHGWHNVGPEDRKLLFFLITIPLFALETSVALLGSARFDTYFYGRHVDPVLAASLIVALSAVIMQKISRADAIIATILIAATFFFLLALLPRPVWDDYSPIHVIGSRIVFDHLHALERRSELLGTIGVVLLFLSLSVATAIKGVWRLFGLVPLLILIPLFQFTNQPWRGDPNVNAAIPAAFREGVAALETCQIAWDRGIQGRQDNHQYFRLQYYFPDCSVERVFALHCQKPWNVFVTQRAAQACEQTDERFELPPGLTVQIGR